MWQRIRSSVWVMFGLRAVGVAAALLLLAWVGARGVSAAPPVIGEASLTSADLDASAASVPVAVPLPAPAPVAAPAPVSARASPDAPVFLNHASADDLRRLPGIGAKRAEQILVLRQKMGRFARVEDLMRVKGIGRAAIKKWRPLVRLDAPSSPDAG